MSLRKMPTLVLKEAIDFPRRLFRSPSQKAGHGLPRMVDNVTIDMSSPSVTHARAEDAAQIACVFVEDRGFACLGQHGTGDGRFSEESQRRAHRPPIEVQLRVAVRWRRIQLQRRQLGHDVDELLGFAV